MILKVSYATSFVTIVTIMIQKINAYDIIHHKIFHQCHPDKLFPSFAPSLYYRIFFTTKCSLSSEMKVDPAVQSTGKQLLISLQLE